MYIYEKKIWIDKLTDISTDIWIYVYTHKRAYTCPWLTFVKCVNGPFQNYFILLDLLTDRNSLSRLNYK